MIKDYKGAKLYYLPWYDKENTVFIDLARVIDLSFRVLQEKIDIVERNLFIDTALEALDLYQRDLGLQISQEVPLEQKRRMIQGYLNYLHEQTTEKVVGELLKSFENETSEIELMRNIEIDTYDVVLRYKMDTKHNGKDLNETLKKILPAHLLYILKIIAESKNPIYYGMATQTGKKITLKPYVAEDFESHNEVYHGMGIYYKRIIRKMKAPEVFTTNYLEMIEEVTAEGERLKYE